MRKQTLASIKRRTQGIFNEYIRLRDKAMPCISCSNHSDKLQAGHFFPVKGYDALRFDEDNVHGECPRCNLFDDAHLIYYQDNLKDRIGQERLEILKAKAKALKQAKIYFTKEELLSLQETYKNKINVLRSR